MRLGRLTHEDSFPDPLPLSDAFRYWWVLHLEPKPRTLRHDVFMPSLFWTGVRGYARIARLEGHFEGPMKEFGQRMRDLGVSTPTTSGS